jgi:1,4-dihydroxy-2-naphthoyl-CoA hydrolase
MSIWKSIPDLTEVNRTLLTGLAGHLRIEFTGYDEQSLTTVMPVTDDVRQPQGLLSGGASAALAEITGGIAGSHCIDSATRFVVGQELSISHLNSVPGGRVSATARPLRLGGRSQVWHIDLRDEAGRLTAVARLTAAVLERRVQTP